VDESLIVGKDFRKQNGYVETKLLLGRRDRPTAIFATGDMITLGALEAVAEEGIEVPRDLSIVAFDDVESAEFFKCPITVVAQPKEMIGEVAVKLLIDEMKSPANHETRHIVLKPDLVIRDSVAPVRQASQAEAMVESG
jgi:LacI family transcriptional regulator